jgi:putative transposase
LVDTSSYAERISMIQKHKDLSISRQCRLLCTSKSSYYYKHKYSDQDLEIMACIDQIYCEFNCYWSRRISKQLQLLGYDVWRKKTRKYMSIMGICAIYPKPRTSIPNQQNEKYPYLLKWVTITHPNQVWSTDITYIKIPWWFVYLMAVIDWYSRYIIAWDIWTSMDSNFCNSVLEKALEQWTPEIFNSDQWSQFTASTFTNRLKSAWVQISMDGVWRCYDNIRIERLRRTIKYEDIHINEYQTSREVYQWLSLYINKYNNKRLHSSLNYSTPAEYYNS